MTFHQSESKSEAIQKAIKFVNAKNSHQTARLNGIVSDDAMFHFLDMDMHFTFEWFWQSMTGIFEAMPDLAFTFSSISEPRPGKVVLEDYFGFGHHSGEPMELPNQPVKVPPTGLYIDNEPVRLTITIKNNQIVDIVADSRGKNPGLVGPHGFYIKALVCRQEQQASKKKWFRRSKGSKSINTRAA